MTKAPRVFKSHSHVKAYSMAACRSRIRKQSPYTSLESLFGLNFMSCSWSRKIEAYIMLMLILENMN